MRKIQLSIQLKQDWLLQWIVLLSRDLNNPFQHFTKTDSSWTVCGVSSLRSQRGSHHLHHHHHHPHTDSDGPRRCVDESGYLRQRRKQFAFTLRGARPERQALYNSLTNNVLRTNEASYNMTGRRTRYGLGESSLNAEVFWGGRWMTASAHFRRARVTQLHLQVSQDRPRTT